MSPTARRACGRGRGRGRRGPRQIQRAAHGPAVVPRLGVEAAQPRLEQALVATSARGGGDEAGAPGVGDARRAARGAARALEPPVGVASDEAALACAARRCTSGRWGACSARRQEPSPKIALDRRALYREPEKIPMSGPKLASPITLGLALCYPEPRAARGRQRVSGREVVVVLERRVAAPLVTAATAAATPAASSAAVGARPGAGNVRVVSASAY
jgi:hypothetical protein